MIQKTLLKAYSFSYLADGIFISSLPLLALNQGSDPSQGAMLVALFNMPWLFSAFSGKIIDTCAPIKILQYSNLVRSLLSFLVVAIFFFEAWYNIYWLYLIVFCIGICEVFYENTLPCIPPKIMEKKELLEFNSKAEFLSRFFRMILGKFLGPVSVGISPILAPVVNTILFMATSIGLQNKNIPIIQNLNSPSSELETRAGLWIKENPVFMKMMVMSCLSNAVFATLLATVPIYITTELNFGEYLVGTVMAFMGLGYILGAKIIRYTNTDDISSVFIYTAVGISVSTSLLPFFGNIYVYPLAMLIFGICMSIRNIIGWTYMQQTMPEHIRGRITAIQRMFGWGGCAVGPLAGSIIIDLTNIKTELFFIAVLTVVVLLISYNLSRKNSHEFILQS